MQFFSDRYFRVCLWLLALALGSLVPAEARGGGERLESRLDRLYRDVPVVVQADEVYAHIRTGRIPQQIYLLDTRSLEEWKVSRLPAAEFVDYRSFSMEAVAHIPKDARIILYCAVGRRSGNVGEELREAGYTNVADMYGGILLWAEEGFPLVNEKGPVDRVHGSRRRYGKRLRHPDIEVVY